QLVIYRQGKHQQQAEHCAENWNERHELAAERPGRVDDEKRQRADQASARGVLGHHYKSRLESIALRFS
ncbi:MAG TPA: hypothetical protein VGK77_24250, partial [Candidatus Binatia bacterium]